MENATKALLIAASLLIVIVLIAVSLKILAPAAETTEEVSKVSSSLGVSTFNSQFEKYAGVQSAAEVKSLISMVLTTWRADSQHNVSVVIMAKTGNGFEANSTCDNVTSISGIIGDLQTSYFYTVDLSLYDSNGYLTKITIS